MADTNAEVAARAAYGTGVPGAVNLLPATGMEADLAAVENELRAAVTTADELLTQAAGHLLLAGGKRLRPALACAAGRLLAPHAPASSDVVLGGAAVELVHVGSLYHDDVMDDAGTRHGVQSVNSRWGNLVAILAGDFLLAKASEIAAGLGTEVSALLAATIGRLCEGQVAELQSTFNPARTEDAYFRSIEGKTASLMSASCRIGALAAGHDRTTVEALTTYGLHLGLTFQIVDDLLDVVSTDAELGKPAGHDVIEGSYHLPVLRFIAGGGRSDILGRAVTTDETAEFLAELRASDAVASTLATARECADRATQELKAIDAPASEVSGALANLPARLCDDVEARAHGIGAL